MGEKIRRSQRNFHFETIQLHAGQERPDPATGARAVPIYQTSSFVFDNCAHAEARFNLSDAGNIYGRLTNPTQDVFEQRMAALEGGVAALATASGAAALAYTFENLTRAGDHLVAAQNIYGGTYNFLAHTLAEYGVTTTFVDPSDLKAVEQAIRENTKGVFIETLGNPNSDVSDIRAIADIAHRSGIPLVIDNTFGTPYLIRPIEHGADIVVHSATKFIGGHGTTLGGAIIENGEFNWNQPERYPHFAKPDASYHGINFATDIPGAGFVTRIRAKVLRDTGAAISPISAWFFIQGLETLSLRVERHVYNATKVAEYLEAHPKVAKVNYPGLKSSPYHKLQEKYLPKGAGSIFSIELKDGFEAARKFIDNLEIFSDLANVGDSKSLVVHPASTTHQQLDEAAQQAAGITPGTVRISVGIENVDDLLNDLEQALAKI